MILLTLFSQTVFLAIGLLGIGFLIGLHEFGHFLFCKLFNVATPSFSIGFGPALWKKKIGETLFSVSLIPLGGFVEIAGSQEIGQGEQKEALRDDERSLLHKPYWQKMCILLGGVFLNFVFAYAAIILVLALGAPGTPLLPQTITNRIEKVEPNSAAEKAGIQIGDQVVSLDSVHFNLDNPKEFFEKLTTLEGKTVPIEIKRDNAKQELSITFAENKKIGMLGVAFATASQEPLPLFAAISQGIKLTNTYIANVATFIKSLFTRRSLEGTGGPVGIIAATMGGAQQGLKVYLLLLAIISINLAVLNLLPIPILDGGQVVVYTIEALARRRLPDAIKMYIHIACWLLFLGLIVYLTFYDIQRIIISLLPATK